MSAPARPAARYVTGAPGAGAPRPPHHDARAEAAALPGRELGAPGRQEREPVTSRPGQARCDLTELIVTQCAHCTGRTGDGRTAPPGRKDPSPPSPPRSPGPGAPRICLSCGGGIIPGQAVERIAITRGRCKGSARYRHTRLEDCRAALAMPPGGNAALIGCYQELASVRVVSPRHTQT
jgi:hypothetical protein